MRHILRILPDWDEDNRWEQWTIHPHAPHNRGWTMRDENGARLLENWGDWLAERFTARRLKSWPNYRCIADINDDEIVQVSLASAPSSHQRLESLLWLRAWLRDAATPDECARLLAI